MRAESDQQPEIQRHRAAIRRSDFSVPLKCVLRDNLLEHGDSFFDYGCGHGDDLRRIQALGFDCDGWDPVHRPDVPRRAADAVNLGYVLNVIGDGKGVGSHLPERPGGCFAQMRPDLACSVCLILPEIGVFPNTRFCFCLAGFVE
jgi:hypothetical protein